MVDMHFGWHSLSRRAGRTASGRLDCRSLVCSRLRADVRASSSLASSLRKSQLSAASG